MFLYFASTPSRLPTISGDSSAKACFSASVWAAHHAATSSVLFEGGCFGKPGFGSSNLPEDFTFPPAIRGRAAS